MSAKLFQKNGPLYSVTKQKIVTLRETLKKANLTPWIWFNSDGVRNIPRFDGGTINIAGCTYGSSQAMVFWESIKPFLKDMIVNTLDGTLETCHRRGSWPEEPYIRETAMLLDGYLIDPIYRDMAEIDQRIRGNGNPKSVRRRDVTDEIAEMVKFLDNCKDEMIQGINEQNELSNKLLAGRVKENETINANKIKPVKERLKELLDEIPDTEVIQSLAQGAGVDPEIVCQQQVEHLDSTALGIHKDYPCLPDIPFPTGKAMNRCKILKEWAIQSIRATDASIGGDKKMGENDVLNKIELFNHSLKHFTTELKEINHKQQNSPEITIDTVSDINCLYLQFCFESDEIDVINRPGFTDLPITHCLSEASGIIGNLKIRADAANDDRLKGNPSDWFSVWLSDAIKRICSVSERLDDYVWTERKNSTGPASNQSLSGGDRAEKTGFKFSKGQIHYNGKEIAVSMGRQYEILKKLAEKTGEVISYSELDSQSVTSASEQLRTDISEIKKSLKTAKIPFTINSKRTEGYILTSK
jgi:hypothetical protein